MLINTTPHLINHGFGFDRPFHAWQMIRGQEVDRYRTDPIDPKVFPFAMEKARAPFLLAQYYRNWKDRRKESDYSTPQVMDAALTWLERNQPTAGIGHEKLFLWLDIFDVHEPWDPPRWYVDLYDAGYVGEEIVYPKRGPCSDFTETERHHIRALYAANITMFDRWLGYFLDGLEALGMTDRTALFFTSDHGQHMGDHRDYFCKSNVLYQEMARWVLMVRLPGRYQEGLRLVTPLAQPVDLLPTILDLVGVASPAWAEGCSLRGLWEGESFVPRDMAFSGTALPWPNTAPVSATDGRWSFLDAGDREAFELYDLMEDPEQTVNLVERLPRQASRWHDAVLAYLRERQAPLVCYYAFEEARPGGPRTELDLEFAAERRRFPNVFVPENYTPFPFGDDASA
jgi:arylsulfatase A-like enzyme